MELQKESDSLNLTERESTFFFKGLKEPYFSWECVSLMADQRTFDF
jgi:hypothetical protein